MLHLNQDEILEFAAGQSEARDAERIFAHMDTCEACAQRYEAVQRIRSDFEGSWEEFVQEFHARSIALLPAAEARPGVDLVIRGLLDETSRLATAAMERVSGALTGLGRLDAAFQPAYSGVGDIADTGEAARLSTEASADCAAGRDQNALRKLQRASELDARAGMSASLTLTAGGRRIGEVVVDASRRSVSVLVDLDRPVEAIGYAILSPDDTRRVPRRARLEAVEGASYFLAEFEDVPGGAFSLKLEID